MNLTEREKRALLELGESPKVPEIRISFSIDKGKLSKTLKANLIQAIQTVLQEVQLKKSYWRDLTDSDKRKVMDRLYPHFALLYGKGGIIFYPFEEETDDFFRKECDRYWEEIWDQTHELILALKESMVLPVKEYKALFSAFRFEVGTQEGKPAIELEAEGPAGKILSNLLALLQALPGHLGVCKECGRLYFSKTRRKSHFCSDRCRTNWHNRLKLEARKIRAHENSGG